MPGEELKTTLERISDPAKTELSAVETVKLLNLIRSDEKRDANTFKKLDEKKADFVGSLNILKALQHVQDDIKRGFAENTKLTQKGDTLSEDEKKARAQDKEDLENDMADLEALAQYLYAVPQKETQERFVDISQQPKSYADILRSDVKNPETVKLLEALANEIVPQQVVEEKSVVVNTQDPEVKNKVEKKLNSGVADLADKKVQASTLSEQIPELHFNNFKFFKTRINGKYESLKQDEIAKIKTFFKEMDPEEATILINFLNTGNIKGFQERIGMKVNGKGPEKADGMFGIWTYKKLEDHALLHKVATPAKTPSTPTPEVKTSATQDNASKVQGKETSTGGTSEKTRDQPSLNVAKGTGSINTSNDGGVDTLGTAKQSKTVNNSQEQRSETSTGGTSEKTRDQPSLNVAKGTGSINTSNDGGGDTSGIVKKPGTATIRTKQKPTPETRTSTSEPSKVQTTIEAVDPQNETVETTDEAELNTLIYDSATMGEAFDAYKDRSDAKLLNGLMRNKLQELGIYEANYKVTGSERKMAKAIQKGLVLCFDDRQLNSEKARALFERCKANYEKGEPVPTNFPDFITKKTQEKKAQEFYKAYAAYRLDIKNASHTKKTIGLLEKALVTNGLDLQELYKKSCVNRIPKSVWKGKNLSREEKKSYKEDGILASDVQKFKVACEQLDKRSAVHDKFLGLLSDFNFDGVHDMMDKEGLKTGLQLKTLYAMVKTEFVQAGKSSEDADNQIARHLIEFARYGDKDFFAEGGDTPETLQSLYDRMKQDIRNTKKIQNLLVSSPLEVRDILSYGKEASSHALKQIEGMTDQERKDLNDWLAKQPDFAALPPAYQEHLATSLASYIYSQFSNNTKISANANLGGAAGLNLPLNQILQGLSLNLGAGITNDGKTPIFGASLAWDRDWLESQPVGLITGGSIGLGGPAFIPIASLHGGFRFDINNHELNTSLDALKKRKIHLTGNVTMIGMLPSWGVNLGMRANKLEGIQAQYKNIRTQTESITQSFMHKLLTPESLKTPEEQKAFIKELLEKTYKRSEKATLEQATNNLYRMMGYFDLQTVIDEIDPVKKQAKSDYFVKVIADFYAEQWRSTSLKGMGTGRGLSGANMGVQFMAGFCPIATMALEFSKYHSLQYEDATKSMGYLKSRDRLGMGNVKHEELSLEKKHLDQRNAYLEQLNLTPPAPKLEVENGEFYLPLELISRNILNVTINSKLKECVTQSPDGKYIVFPITTEYRFLQAQRGDKQTFALNIGSQYRSKEDMLINMKNYQQFLGEKVWENAPILVKQDFEAMMKALKEKYPEQSELLNQLSFDDGTKSVVYDGKSYTSGTFTMVKSEEGLSFHYTEAPGKLRIDCKVLQAGAESSTFALAEDANLRAWKLLENRGDELIKKLSKLDSQQNIKLYGLFLKNAKAGQEQVEVVAKDLLKLLPEGDEDLALLRTKLSSGSLAEKALIVNRMKSIFAIEYAITTGASLKNIVAMRDKVRKDAYKKMTDANGQSFPERAEANFRNKFLRTLKGDENFAEPTLTPNLFGFTAFYRQGIGDGKGLSMTALGGTSIVKGSLTEVSKEDADLVKAWLLGKTENGTHTPGNLEKHTTELNQLGEKIKQQAKITDELTAKQIQTLLKGQEITLEDGKSLKLNVKFVYYLMGECANESVGIQIEGIQLTTPALDEGDGGYAEGEISTQYDKPTGIYTNAGETNHGAVTAKSSDVTLGIASGTPQKKTASKGGNPGTQGGDQGGKTGDVDNSKNSGSEGSGKTPVDPNNASQENPLNL